MENEDDFFLKVLDIGIVPDCRTDINLNQSFGMI